MYCKLYVILLLSVAWTGLCGRRPEADGMERRRSRREALVYIPPRPRPRLALSCLPSTGTAAR